MNTVIEGLHGSPTYDLSVMVYRRHEDAGNGFCARCGLRVPCPASRHAAAVIVAAGDDPRRHHAAGPSLAAPAGPVRAGPAGWLPEEQATGALNYVGYHIGGRSRPSLDSPGYDYQRDTE